MSIKYKIQESEGNHFTIIKLSSNPNFTGWSIPRDTNNSMYNEFIQDVKDQGLGIVEGPTVGVTTAYDIARQAEYPSIVDQLDKIYHGGVDAWKADIKAIKDKYPKTQVGVTTVAAVPSWVQTEVDKLIS